MACGVSRRPGLKGQGMVRYGMVSWRTGIPDMFHGVRCDSKSKSCYKSSVTKIVEVALCIFGIILFHYNCLCLLWFRFETSKLWDSFDLPAGCGKRIPRGANVGWSKDSGESKRTQILRIATQSKRYQTTPWESLRYLTNINRLLYISIFTIHICDICVLRCFTV